MARGSHLHSIAAGWFREERGEETRAIARSVWSVSTQPASHPLFVWAWCRRARVAAQGDRRRDKEGGGSLRIGSVRVCVCVSG